MRIATEMQESFSIVGGVLQREEEEEGECGVRVARCLVGAMETAAARNIFGIYSPTVEKFRERKVSTITKYEALSPAE